jgi:hypothetical protein
MMTKSEIEAKAKEIYLSKYGSVGGRWELVETKDVWHKMAVDWFNCDEGTRMVFDGQIDQRA